MEITRIRPEVYVLSDRAGSCSNLVVGKDRALVFDTGAGVDDLYATVRQITQLPLVAVNSHGHFDHIGGNCQFDRVYMHPDDLHILKGYTPEILAKWREELTGGQETPRRFEEVCLGNAGAGAAETIRELDFDELDLGGVRGRIVPLKGHTGGSVGIWFEGLRLLLSGDALTPVMCLIFENHLSAEVQYHTLRAVDGLDFDEYLTSHHRNAFPREMIPRLMRCIENSGNGRWHPYRYPYPPYAHGRIYVDLQEGEPVALICRE